MRDFKSIKDFYRVHPVDLSFLTNCSWRQFRFLLPSGRFWKLPQQVRNNNTFNKWILQKKPLDVYYSTSCWLAPENVGARSDIFSQNLFIYSDLVFDIDGKGHKEKYIEKARKESIKLIEYLDQNGFRLKYISFSGSKGFHVVCHNPVKDQITDPLAREENTKNVSAQISNKILAEGIKIDPRVTVDTRRILRVPGTINSKSGLSCRLTSRDEISNYNAKEIIKNTSRVNKVALKIPLGNDQTISLFRKILGLYRLRARSSPTPFYYASFLSNRVTSTKIYVPIIEFKKSNETKIINELYSIMKNYNLSDAFLFKGEPYFAIIPFAFQKRRIEKILKASNSSNLDSFKKYHQTFTRISSKVNMNYEEISKKPAFIKRVKCDFPPKIVSAPHQRFLFDSGICYKEFTHLIGSEDYIIRHSVIEN
jgi:DNA primase catalytic subunit